MSNNYTVPCTISRMPIYHEQKCVFCILNDDFVKRKADWQIIMPVVYGAYDASNNSFLVDETDIKNKHAESVVKDLNPDDNLKDFVYLAESLRNTCFIERSVWEFMNKNPVQIDESFVETYREHLRIWVKVSDLLEKEERFDTTKLMESFKKNTIEGNHKLADMTHRFMMEKESTAMKIAYNVYDNVEKYGSELVKIWEVIETLKETYFKIEPWTYLYGNPAKKIYRGLAKEFARISRLSDFSFKDSL